MKNAWYGGRIIEAPNILSYLKLYSSSGGLDFS